VRQRWVALGLAAASLLMLYALLVPRPVPPSTGLSPPLSTENGPEGFAAAWRWLSGSAIPVISFRDRYEHLPAVVGASGNVLLTSAPQRLAVRAHEQAALERWIERGNTLLVLIALDDTPSWAQGGALNLSRLQNLLRIRFEVSPPPKPSAGKGADSRPLSALLAHNSVRLEAIGSHPLLRGVREIRVVSDLPASHWRGKPRDGATLAIARRVDDGNAALWLQPRGQGQIVVCALAAPFDNAHIAQADNAQLLANIIAWSRTPRGAVLFDDGHQGLVSFYDPQAFFADPRLHRSLGWIGLLWLVWVLGAQPLRATQSQWAPLDEAALIDASGRFFSRHVAAAPAARELLENFFNELHRRLRQAEDGTPPWEWLAVQPRVTSVQLERLRRSWQRAAANENVDLARLQNLLVEVRGRFT
jgi:hypothetical protein